MKKITFLLLFNLLFLTNAQFSFVHNQTGNPVNNGDIITINTNNETHCFTVTNTSNANIYLTLEVQAINNTNGSEMTYCFGVSGGGGCYLRMNEGDIKQGGNPLPPGQSTGSSDIDFTHKDGTGIDANGNPVTFSNYPKDYILKIYASNTNGGAQIGNAITFTYRFDPNAADIKLWKNNGIYFYVYNRDLYINSLTNFGLQIFYLTGKKVLKKDFRLGQQKINLSDLKKGIYILVFQKNGKKIYRKFLLK